ncbi:MAG: iron-containing alcohol dehydrogenase [Planctomycetaceae bacterium]|nr:iron-containing alcohol dehydrogenase [Planctomycetaceae bacterium]
MLLPTISYLTEIHFAVGSVRLLAEVLAERRLTRPLLVTDSGIVAAGLTSQLPVEFSGVFAGVQTNPTLQNVEAGVTAFRDSGCDSIVALGGGSPIDCAKAVAILATHEPPLEQYALIRGGLSRITANKPPVIAIPTTSGTGSEVGRASLITFDETTKLAIVGKHVIPDVAICDPALTIGLPPLLTAATGMDAISHCVETFCSPRFNPVAEAIALDGLGRACRWLPTAVDDGTNLEARSELMMASMEGALAFQKGLGLIHSLSHPLGALPRGLHHGTLNSIFLPHVLRFNQQACAEKIDRMAAVAGIGTATSVSGAELAQWFTTFAAAFGLPGRLSELGILPNELDLLPEAAMQDHSTPTNPRSVTFEDCAALYSAAW